MEKMNRRDFLKLAGAAVATGLTPEAPSSGKEIVEKEKIPNEESIRNVFELLRGEHSYNERRKLNDDRGVYLWEVEFQIEGGTAEFSYMRAGRYEVGGASSDTKIYICYFDEDGMPEARGNQVAEYQDGQWKITDSESLN